MVNTEYASDLMMACVSVGALTMLMVGQKTYP